MPPEQHYIGTEVVRELSAPELVVRTRRSDHRLRAGQSYRVGRDPASDIVMTDTRVSWKHGVFQVERGGWVFADAESTNGTFLGARRVTRIEISGDCVIHLGNADDGPVLRCMPQAPVVPDETAPPAGPPAAPQPQPVPVGAAVGAGAAAAVAEMLPSVDRRPTQRLKLPVTSLRIGRAPDNDVPLTGDPEASRHHAELRKSPTGSYEIVDLGSHNGTFVNGEQVSRRQLTDQDIISIGHSTFRLSGGELRQFVDDGQIGFAANDLVVKVGGGKILLDHISFPIPEKSLVGVIGPSGAGKSTLLGALTGMRPADTGTVLYDNRDLYRHYAELRHRIGLVPQESVLHTQLTARQALQYSAELRFPADTTKSERNTRVNEVMGELGLSKHAQTRADRLSGGQLKRVNVAQELLTKPSVLFLDEPTSGLDPGLDKSVMEQMRDLAHDGRTVIVVTHSVANLDTCDRLLVLVPGGKIAYYGPPADGLTYFRLRGWAEVFQAFEQYPNRDWAAEFAQSDAYKKYVLGQRPAPPAPANGGRDSAAVSALAPKRRGALRQLGTLTRRYLRVTASDRGNLMLLGLLPILLGVLIFFVPAKEGLGGAPHTNGGAAEVLLMLVICICLSGSFGAVRELVKERTIYIRERAAGLSAGAHLFSKLLVLGAIVAVQSAVLVGLGLLNRTMPPSGSFLTSLPLVEIFLAIALLGIASMCLALLVSALVATSERGMLVAVGVTAFQIILSGGAFVLNGMAGLDQLSWLAPARWGFAALASTANLNVIQAAQPGTQTTDPLWNHTSATWLRDMGVLAGLAVIFALLAYLRLRRLSPGRRR
jgi:ABC-type multidrug transport system ATPase subunit/pSer/pThr/pTyr-binding forkhead associated (FHA) protein